MFDQEAFKSMLSIPKLTAIVTYNLRPYRFFASATMICGIAA